MRNNKNKNNKPYKHMMISSEVENAIKANGEDVALPAFNCFY